MSSVTSIAPPGFVVALVLAGALLALVLWLGWRKPTWVLLFALASLAIRPQLLWGGPEVGYEWGLHQTLLVFALAMNALRYGIRRTPNWPILALLATFFLGLAFGDLHPKLTLPFMLMSLALLALPFAFTQVILEPGSRRTCALVIMLTPLLSVALGALLEAAGFSHLFGDYYRRLQGATSNAAVFAALAFAGFAVALHESTRPGRPYAGYLAAVNLALVILSGTRMAIFASVALSAVYLVISPHLREQWRARRGLLLIAGCAIGATLIFYFPILQQRIFDFEADRAVSTRLQQYDLVLYESLKSPWVGVGLADKDASVYGIIHNMFLRALYGGGLISLVGLLTIIGDLLFKSYRTFHSTQIYDTKVIALCAFAGIIGMILSGLTEPVLYQRQVWVPAALALTLWALQHQRQRRRMTTDRHSLRSQAVRRPCHAQGRHNAGVASRRACSSTFRGSETAP